MATVGAFLDRLGFGDRWVFVDLTHSCSHGPWAGKTAELLHGADVLISFGAVNRRPIERWNGRPAIFIDSDPVYNQLKVDNGDTALRTFLEAHTHLFTLGENIGTSRSTSAHSGSDSSMCPCEPARHSSWRRTWTTSPAIASC